MGRICAQMFQFWRFTNQMTRYQAGLTVADRSLIRKCLALSATVMPIPDFSHSPVTAA